MVDNGSIMARIVNNAHWDKKQAKTPITNVQFRPGLQDERNPMCFPIRVHGRPLHTLTPRPTMHQEVVATLAS